MACAFHLINVLVVLDGREGIAILVYLILDVYMDTAFKLWNVFVILVMLEHFVMFVSTSLHNCIN